MKRLAVSTLISLLAILVLAIPGQARLKWCKADPIVELNGTQVRILVGIQEGDLPLVNGPVHVEVKNPESVTQELVSTDTGFNQHGEQVVFTDLNGKPQNGTSFPTNIRVQVPIDESRLVGRTHIPVQVSVTWGDNKPKVVTGTSNLTTVGLSIVGTGG